MNMLIVVTAVFILLVASEVWWRRHRVHNEFSRKFVHISVGSFVAFWPFILSWRQILLLSLAFLIVVGLSKQMNLFRAIHSVQRPTWGELFFALAVGAVALITQDKLVYATALLQMSLADGLAAIVGTNFGRANRYLVLGHAKSVAGTLTFFVVSLVILAGFSFVSAAPVALPLIVAIAGGAAVLENFGVHGLDNLLVPVFVASVLMVTL